MRKENGLFFTFFYEPDFYKAERPGIGDKTTALTVL